ncbi:MAG: hypothetical protein HZB82_02635 [Deltaproteobacteria bacterium]|nr:hypothetical protein [Deltaproteobacteria bacterium]
MKLRDILNSVNFSGTLLACAGIVIMLGGCGGEKKADNAAKETAAPAVTAPAAQQTAPAIPQGSARPEGHPAVDKNDVSMHKASHTDMKGKKEVRLSEAVRARWNEARLRITDSSSGRAVSMTLKVGAVTKLGADDYKLKMDAVVPDYTIAGDHIESRSNEPKNPAVLVTLFKGDKAVARGWVFRDLADFNSYNNERFHIVLELPGAKAGK